MQMENQTFVSSKRNNIRGLGLAQDNQLGVRMQYQNIVCRYCGKQHGSAPCLAHTGACFWM